MENNTEAPYFKTVVTYVYKDLPHIVHAQIVDRYELKSFIEASIREQELDMPNARIVLSITTRKP